MLMPSLEDLKSRIENEGPNGEWSIHDLDPRIFQRNQLNEVWPDNEETYHHLYRRQVGKGDLFDSWAKRRTPVPVHFTFVKYKKSIDNTWGDNEDFDRFGVPEEDWEWSDLIEGTRRELLPLVGELDETYATLTEGRLRFLLGKVKTRIFHTLDDAMYLPWFANTLGTTNAINVKVHAILDHAGTYNGRGLIDLDYSNTRQNDSTLIHEVGHGILGSDHHERRNCVMDNYHNQGLKPFCEEDSATIRRMVGLI